MEESLDEKGSCVVMALCTVCPSWWDAAPCPPCGRRGLHGSFRADATAPEASWMTRITVGVDLYYRRDEYYVDLETTFRAYGAEKGYNMVICDADGDIATQISQMEDFIVQGVDVILLAAADPDALIPVCQEAIDAGIPVICYDGGINSDICATKVIFDFYEDGSMVGDWAVQYINDNLGGTAKVAVLDFPASPIVCGLRAQGFVETVSKLPGVEIDLSRRKASVRVMAGGKHLTANRMSISYRFIMIPAQACRRDRSSRFQRVVCCNAWAEALHSWKNHK